MSPARHLAAIYVQLGVWASPWTSLLLRSLAWQGVKGHSVWLFLAFSVLLGFCMLACAAFGPHLPQVGRSDVPLGGIRLQASSVREWSATIGRMLLLVILLFSLMRHHWIGHVSANSELEEVHIVACVA